MSRLLFLPGAGGDPKFWMPVGELLPTGSEKIYLGWPGLGNEVAHPSVSSIEDLVFLVEAQMGLEPVDILAQSLGGYVALKVALRNPGRIRSLVLATTSAGIDVAGMGAVDWRDEYFQAFPRAAKWVAGPTDDLRERLSDIRQPVLLIWGAADSISPVEVGKFLKDNLPNARLKIVPNGDHSFVNERPSEIVADICEHLGYWSVQS